MEILFLQTGGTIDKDYLPEGDNHGYAFTIEEPAYIPILERADVSFTVAKHSTMKKDSLDITETDRKQLAYDVYNSAFKRVVITHGTDTIGQTARFLAEAGASMKTIVLTGAMRPEKFARSDADFNLGLAVGAVQALPSGVYVALQGLVRSWRQFCDETAVA